VIAAVRTKHKVSHRATWLDDKPNRPILEWANHRGAESLC
jgi:hypothetical protein